MRGTSDDGSPEYCLPLTPSSSCPSNGPRSPGQTHLPYSPDMASSMMSSSAHSAAPYVSKDEPHTAAAPTCIPDYFSQPFLVPSTAQTGYWAQPQPQAHAPAYPSGYWSDLMWHQQHTRSFYIFFVELELSFLRISFISLFCIIYVWPLGAWSLAFWRDKQSHACFTNYRKVLFFFFSFVQVCIGSVWSPKFCFRVCMTGTWHDRFIWAMYLAI